MNELLAHLVGDYLLQNHAMANLKTKHSSWALLHATIYTLPFLFVTQSPLALAVILVTHFFIDRFRLAKYVMRFLGIGEIGWLPEQILKRLGWSWVQYPDRESHDTFAKNFPAETETYLRNGTPPFLGFWLLVLVDNTMHLVINHLSVAYL